MARRRLDQELVRRGLARSRGEAAELIAAGEILLGGVPATKVATLVDAGVAIEVRDDRERFASRGGHKLAGALDRLDVLVEGRYCLDAGASTGGFTDVLLRGGAARVVAVDVGYGQLAWALRTDERVVVLDRTNVRHLRPDDVPPPAPGLVVADLSFISLTAVLEALVAVAAPGADLVLLCKPQFEVGPALVGKGGVVRDPAAWRGALEAVCARGTELGLGVAGVTASPLPGPSGNVEFFAHLRAGAPGAGDPLAEAAIARAITEGVALVPGSMTP